MAGETATNLTGVQKAAILFIVLGPEVSSNIIRNLPEKDIQSISYEIANTVKIKTAIKEAVLNEFVNLNKAKDYILEGGSEYAKRLLIKALGVQKSIEIMDRVGQSTMQYKPFGMARKADSQQLLNLIMNEHPQTIALILCYLQNEKAALVLSGLPESLQSDVSRRIASMKSTSPSVVHEVEKVIEKKLSTVVRSDLEAIGGVSSLVSILNQVSRTTQKSIIEELDRQEPELAEKVKSGMFVFDDIVNLDNASIQKIIREVDSKDFAVALKGSSEKLADAIFRNISKRAGAILKEDIEDLGPIRLAEVEKAKLGIVKIIRKLDEEGEIIISGGGADAVIV